MRPAGSALRQVDAVFASLLVEKPRLPNHRVSPLPWRRVKAAGKFWLEQPEAWDNVVIYAGDPGWRDIVLTGEFISVGGTRCGPLVRYQTLSKRNYIENQKFAGW